MRCVIDQHLGRGDMNMWLNEYHDINYLTQDHLIKLSFDVEMRI